MTAPEFAAWVEFYKNFPFDDFHRYYRPAALNALGKTSMKMDEILDWLQPPQYSEEMTDTDKSFMKIFGIRE